MKATSKQSADLLLGGKGGHYKSVCYGYKCNITRWWIWFDLWGKTEVKICTVKFLLQSDQGFFFSPCLTSRVFAFLLTSLPLSSMTSILPAVISTRSKMPVRKGGAKDVRCSEETLCCSVNTLAQFRITRPCSASGAKQPLHSIYLALLCFIQGWWTWVTPTYEANGCVFLKIWCGIKT